MVISQQYNILITILYDKDIMPIKLFGLQLSKPQLVGKIL